MTLSNKYFRIFFTKSRDTCASDLNINKIHFQLDYFAIRFPTDGQRHRRTNRQ